MRAVSRRYPRLFCAEPCFACAHNRLRAVYHLEFAKDVGDVVADGLAAESKPLGNLGVVIALRDETEDFALTLSQFGEEFDRFNRLEPGKVPHHALGDGCAKDHAASAHRLNRAQDLGFERALEQIAARAGAHRREHRVVVFEHGEHEDANVRAGREDAPCGVNPIHSRHVNIHQDDVRLYSGGKADSILAGGGITDQREIINALRYLNRTGCQWRMLPHDLPPWEKIYYYFSEWRDGGAWERINRERRIEIRVSVGKDPEPSAAILDSQSVQATEMSQSRGYDAGKKIHGIKRYLLVDTLGMVLAVMILTADVQDRDGARK